MRLGHVRAGDYVKIKTATTPRFFFLVFPDELSFEMSHRRNVTLLAAFFMFAGTMHFVLPRGYAAIMPIWVPYPMTMVYLSGILEIAGGGGLLIRSLRRAAAVGLILLLIAVFPANVRMLQNAIARGASPLMQTLLWLRLPLQPLMIYWIYRVAIRRPFAEAQ